jgi:phosphosulfolactate synthase
MPGPGFLDLPVRSAKPRRTGITHVLDRGIPLASPGGTLLEIAWAQGRAPEFLDWAADAGFPCVEVSAGTVPMQDAAKRDLIAEAAERFIVLAEVGSKHAAVLLTPEQWTPDSVMGPVMGPVMARARDLTGGRM